uniref:Aminotran_5 domain-containing protein n=1 Tax=Syphacia muris TaxID=451379 RepID=A0A0N5AU66_9BILA
MAYLDYAGTGKPSEAQLKAIADDLLHLNLSNPHSKHPSGKYTSEIVDAVRSRYLRVPQQNRFFVLNHNCLLLRILEHFNVSLKTHSVIFTSSATEALRVVVEAFDFGNCHESCVCKNGLSNDDNGIFAYLTDSHTSVVGMREIARKNCNCVCVINDIDEIRNLKPDDGKDAKIAKDTYNLFAITAMSNFCGRKYPMDVIDKIRQWKPGHSFVCVDAAAWVSSSAFDLSKYDADFVAVSFYKIFGYPTGVGALIVRRDAGSRLKKHYFGGGTVKLVFHDKFSQYYKDDLNQRLDFSSGTLLNNFFQ